MSDITKARVEHVRLLSLLQDRNANDPAYRWYLQQCVSRIVSGALYRWLSDPDRIPYYCWADYARYGLRVEPATIANLLKECEQVEHLQHISRHIESRLAECMSLCQQTNPARYDRLLAEIAPAVEQIYSACDQIFVEHNTARTLDYYAEATAEYRDDHAEQVMAEHFNSVCFDEVVVSNCTHLQLDNELEEWLVSYYNANLNNQDETVGALSTDTQCWARRPIPQ